MEAIESLLMDMLDDGPIADTDMEAYVLQHDDRTLIADMQRMHAMTPLLQQCAIPVIAADTEVLREIRSSIQSSISRHLLLTRTLWSGLGAAIGGGILWLAVTHWTSDGVDTTLRVEPRPVPQEIVTTPSEESPVVRSIDREQADPSPVSTRGTLRTVQSDLELRMERDRRTVLVKNAVGADAYRQYRDLFHINLALADTAEAVSVLRSAQRWAEQAGDVQAVARCEREIIDLTRPVGR